MRERKAQGLRRRQGAERDVDPPGHTVDGDGQRQLPEDPPASAPMRQPFRAAAGGSWSETTLIGAFMSPPRKAADRSGPVPAIEPAELA